MPAINFELRKVYDFDVYPSAILGSSFKSVTVMGIVDRDTANQSIDTQALHTQVYPFLPNGTPNDPNSYDYVKIRTVSGETTLLGLAWIKDDTVTLVSSTTAQVLIGNVAASDIPRIRDALVMNGFNNLDIKLVT